MQRALTTFVPRCLLYTLKYTSLRSACYSVNKEANIASLASVNDRVKLLWHSGEKDKAFRELEQNSHLFSPENTKEYVEFNSKLAAVHLAQGRTENAEKILNEILSLDIDDSERATAISAVASLVDEAQQIAFLKRRLTLANTDDINRRINADLGATYYNRAVTVTGHGPNATAALKLEALDSAIKHYDLAVNDLHDEDTRISFAKAFMQRGITHHMRIDVDKDMTEKQVLKQIELAREDYTTALALDGSLYYCYFKQGDLSSYLKDSGRAIWEYCEFEKHFEEFCNSDFASNIQKEELYLELLVKKSIMYIYIKDNDMAIKQMKEFIDLDDDVVEPEKMKLMKAKAYQKIGVVHMLQQQYHKVIEANTKALLLDPRLLAAFRDRSIAYSHLELHEEAESDRKQLEFLTRELVFVRK